MLSESRIKNEASSSAVYHRGIRYYNEARVKKLSFDKVHRSFNATVAGSVHYDVAVHFNEDLLVDDYDCDCQAYYEYEGACKHIVALMKVIQEQWAIYFAPPSNNVVFSSPKRTRSGSPTLQSDHISATLMNWFEQELPAASDLSGKKPEANTMIVPTFCLSEIGRRKQHSLEFHIGNNRPYVMKDIPDFLTAYLNKRDLYFGKNYTFRPREAIFDETSAALLRIIIDAHSDEKYLQGWSTYGYTLGLTFSNKKAMRLTNSMLLRFLEIMEDKTFDAYINNHKVNGISIYKGRPPFPLNLRGIPGGIKLALDTQSQVYYGLDADNRYIYHQGLIYHVDDLFAQTITPLIAAFAQNPRPELSISDNDVARFFSTVRPALESVIDIDVEPALSEKYSFEEPEKKVYFDRFQNGIAARIEFQYSTHRLNPALEQHNEAIKNSDGKVLLRSIKKEKQLINIFRQYKFQLLQGSFVLEEEALVFKFLQDALPELETLSELFYSDDFKARIKYDAGVFPGVRMNTGSGLLELSLEYQDISPREFIGLLKSYKMKKNYYRLKNGSYLALDNSELKGVVELMAELDIRSHEIAAGKIQLPAYRAPYLDQAARARGLNIKGNGAFKALVREIREPQESEYEIPASLQAKLRHYQENGFKWLKSLSVYGFGGILADDMGLGKTLQVLSLLLSEKAKGCLTSLAIVPTSLMYHWQDEARRFTPDLKVVIMSGNQRERREIMASLDMPDLIVTSYALIKRDLALYQDMQFRYCILDEAQNIKNPNTQVAKTVKHIQASARFALTGTPIENSLSELWSIFDFLMPGYLLSHNKFRSRYEVPIVKDNQPEAIQELKRHIQPFVMRRMKREVLKELPKKTENKMSNSMTAEQRKLYLAYLLQAQNEFREEVQKYGFNRSQIKILSILTRLRQICCHPSLFIENYTGGSGKLELLMEILVDAIDSGHRILVFSQFTSMLSLIKAELHRSSISYYYLDGSTAAEQRMKLVHSFNAGQQKVFLISLKAGGTGLNLTGADVVIHYDPWWNPAVEDQATDRAYRIGQKNAVQVIKLISKDSVEEKIFDLQEKKKALIDAVIQPGENFLSKMSEEDIRMLFEV
ncbi:superfamily ii dna/rna helicase, snf2 family [hydrocarbon metagenome]|uniref:Superfamily ii dna/rna helicase, snf2 family n=1 Tax=hydrocarbon metagenome TaxID=938273 RepID=A0A0W8E2H8_9ZZZZ